MGCVLTLFPILLPRLPSLYNPSRYSPLVHARLLRFAPRASAWRDRGVRGRGDFRRRNLRGRFHAGAERGRAVAAPLQRVRSGLHALDPLGLDPRELAAGHGLGSAVDGRVRIVSRFPGGLFLQHRFGLTKCWVSARGYHAVGTPGRVLTIMDHGVCRVVYPVLGSCTLVAKRPATGCASQQDVGSALKDESLFARFGVAHRLSEQGLGLTTCICHSLLDWSKPSLAQSVASSHTAIQVPSLEQSGQPLSALLWR